MKKICELVILKKLGLSKKFLRKILHTRKLVLGVRMVALRLIMNILALKLNVGNKRANNRVKQI